MNYKLILIIPFVLIAIAGTVWFEWQYHKEKEASG